MQDHDRHALKREGEQPVVKVELLTIGKADLSGVSTHPGNMVASAQFPFAQGIHKPSGHQVPIPGKFDPDLCPEKPDPGADRAMQGWQTRMLPDRHPCIQQHRLSSLQPATQVLLRAVPYRSVPSLAEDLQASRQMCPSRLPMPPGGPEAAQSAGLLQWLRSQQKTGPYR